MSRKRLIVISLLSLPLLVLLAAGGLLFTATQTEFGRDFLRAQIEALVSEEDGIKLSLQKIDGNLLSHFEISQIVLSDSNGEWLRAEGLAISWSPLELLRKRLSINEIMLKNLEILREPQLPPSSEETAEGGIPSLPFDVALQALDIDRIRLDEALAGKEAIFRLGLSLNAATEEAVRSKLDLQQLEGGQAVMTGLVEFHPANETLDVDITFFEPENGLVAKTLELPGAPAVELSILGEGALSSWQGQVLANAGDLLSADLIVSTAVEEVAGNRKIKVELQGDSRFTALLPPEIRPLFEPKLNIESTVTWSEQDQVVSLASTTLQSAALRLSAEGNFNIPYETLAAKVKLIPLDTAAIAPLIAPAEFDGAELGIIASGDLQSLDTDIDLLVNGLKVSDEISVQELTGSFQTKISPERFEQLPLAGEMRLEGFSGLPSEATILLGEKLDLDFKLLLDLPENQLSLEDVTAEGAGFSLSGKGGLGLETRAANMGISLLLTDLSLLAPSLGQAIAGRLKIDADLETLDFEKQVALKLHGVSKDLDPGDPEIKALIGEAIDLKATVNATPVTILVESLDLTTAFATIAASGEAPVTFDDIKVDFEAVVADLSSLRDLTGAGLAGAAILRGELSGSPDNPAVTGTASVKGLRVDDVELGKLQSDFSIQALATAPKGSLRTQLEHPEATVDLATNFAIVESKRLDLTDLSLKVADAGLGGALSIPFDGAPVTGQLKGQVPTLSSLAQIAGQPVEGSLSFIANLIANDNRQDAEVTIDASDLRPDRQDPDGPRIASLKARITAQDLLQTPTVNATFEAAEIRAGALNLDRVDVEVQGTSKAGDFKFAVRNAATPALALDGSGSVELKTESSMLALSSFEGTFEDRAIQLLQPLVVRQNGPQTRVEDFKLRLDGGELAGSGALNATSADAGITLKTLPLDLLALLEPELASSGVLNGQADFTFTDGTAAGQFQFDVEGAKPTNQEFANLPALNARLSGGLKNRQLTFDAEVEGLEDMSAKASGTLPFEVTLDPVAAGIPESAPLEASAKLRGDLAKIWPLLAIDEHLLAGKLAADMQARGSLNNPKLDGTASLTEGRYENLELGTLLTDMRLAVKLDDTNPVELSLSAKDGGDGTLAVNGEIDFQGGGPEPRIDLATKLTRTQLLRRDDVSAQASGDIQLSGTPSALSVTGDITTDLIEINIGGALPASIVDLPVEERNRPGTTNSNGNGNTEDSAPATTTNLKLSLSMPRRVFIRGRGLDSEWSGQFKVTGTAEKPVVQGELSPVRGDFSFAGKSFALQKGKVSLAGSKEIDPDLDLSAVYEVTDFKAIVAITGTASSPEIGLSSQPELPQDEILARVLFGKATGQLSPVEALQLAEAVASISGKLGSGEGILGLVRNTIGVDVLTAGTNEKSGEVEVRAGKYLTDDVFVGVSQGTDPTSTKVTVEVEVTPNISVESDVGQDATGRVGVFWKFDY